MSDPLHLFLNLDGEPCVAVSWWSLSGHSPLRRSREVLDSLMDLAGSRSIFEDNPLQRFWRDVHVMGQHVALNYEAAMRNYGRVLMGLDQDLTFY